MTLGLGGYRVGNGPIRLKRTSVINKAFNNLEQAGNFTTQKTVTVDAAKGILGQLGKNAQKAIKILPNAGDISYIGAHGTMQMLSEGKQVFYMVESLRRPISSFIKDNVAKLVKRIF